MDKGIVYGVGVGPGDPELMTLKAARVIRACPVIAAAGKTVEESRAYQIAGAVIPEIGEKELAALSLPMTTDEEKLRRARLEAAERIEKYLDAGLDVAYITLGDPTIYCTFSYLQPVLEADGYRVKLVSGIPSFCAAAARLGIPLTEESEELHVIPAFYNDGKSLSCPGKHVLMKSAGRIREVKALLKENGLQAQAVENCGMPEEAVYRSVDEIPDDAGYYTLILV